MLEFKIFSATNVILPVKHAHRVEIAVVFRAIAVFICSTALVILEVASLKYLSKIKPIKYMFLAQEMTRTFPTGKIPLFFSMIVI